jgi:formylmethanofuran dehydrogenase subunit E
MSYEQDIDIQCDCCGDYFLPSQLSSDLFAGSLVCESCADALEFEAEFHSRNDFDMGA